MFHHPQGAPPSPISPIAGAFQGGLGCLQEVSEAVQAQALTPWAAALSRPPPFPLRSGPSSAQWAVGLSSGDREAAGVAQGMCFLWAWQLLLLHLPVDGKWAGCAP